MTEKTNETATKKTAKKATKKKATSAKKTTKKKGTTAKKTTAKKTTKGTPAKKDGLRKPQIRILLALLKKPNQTRAELAKSAPVDGAACVEYVGSHKDDVREANDKKHFPSLISLKLVKQQVSDIKGKDVVSYSLTATGKKEAQKHK